MQFVISFTVLYLLRKAIAQNLHILARNPQMVCVSSNILYTLLVFPFGLFSKKSKTRKKDRQLTRCEVIFCLLHPLVLVGTVMLQLLPAIPSEVVEISFRLGHRWLNMTLSTYNQKIPIALIVGLCLFDLYPQAQCLQRKKTRNLTILRPFS